jgi:cell division protein FtsN
MFVVKKLHPCRAPGMRRQLGGTFWGLVAGIVVGVAASLVVAMYVMKVPVPFSPKNVTRNADHDAAEAKRNQGWEPNAPLHSKRSPATPEPTPESAKAADPSKPTPEPPKPGTGDAVKAPAVSADPLGDLARARAATTAVPPTMPPGVSTGTPSASAPAASGSAIDGTPAADPFDYFVQVGAFSTGEQAEAQRAKVAMLGWEARISEREQAGRQVFRVRVGPYARRDDADRAREKLDSAGLQTTMVRVQR